MRSVISNLIWTGHGMGLWSMGSNIWWRNVHTGQRQGEGTGPVPLPELSLVPIPCSVNQQRLFNVQWNVSESWFDRGSTSTWFTRSVTSNLICYMKINVPSLCVPCSKILNQWKVGNIFYFCKISTCPSHTQWSWISTCLEAKFTILGLADDTVKICQCELNLQKIMTRQFMVSRIHSYPTHSGNASHKFFCGKPFLVIKCQIVQHCHNETKHIQYYNKATTIKQVLQTDWSALRCLTSGSRIYIV